MKVQTITGRDGFGLRKLVAHERIVKLRRMSGYIDEVPVVIINEGGRKKKYKIINLETGKLGKT